MHVHLPKPLHGWRAFVGEVGIIVLGVLIALAAEQAIEAWQWHEKVAVVRTSIMGELSNDRARWEVDAAAARCALADVARLDSWAQDGVRAPAPAAPSIRSANLFSMHTANWSLAVSSQTLDHFPIQEQLAFAALNDGIAHRQAEIDKASDLLDRVQVLIPLTIDQQSRRGLRETLGSLKVDLGAMLINDPYMKRHFDAVGAKADSSDFAAEAAAARCGKG